MNQTIPANEPERLVTLTNYAVLDTLPEAGFDEITELAAQICGCPAALVSFVDASRQWIKAKYGPLPAELSECPREISICTATICNNDILYVSDLIKDQRFNTSPLVTGDMHIRFYCGVPLITQDGYALGTLCVIDFEPREITFEQQEACGDWHGRRWFTSNCAGNCWCATRCCVNWNARTTARWLEKLNRTSCS